MPRLTRTPNDKEQQGEDRVDDGEGGTSGDEALWLARLVGRRHKNKNNADTSEPTPIRRSEAMAFLLRCRRRKHLDHGC